ncbi:substrate-binding periplasmic protein [Marinobacter daqiaonensis]|nr:transporter substrate-binding domain-containing protein [Marinobacter daqiaonensis]
MFGYALLFIFLILSQPVFAGQRTVTLVGDRWCPHNCLGMGERSQGHLVDKASEALQRAGYRVEYVEMPWSRAILEVESGNFDGLVGASPDESPALIFPRQPLAIARHSFYTLPSFNWLFEGLHSLETITLGVVQSYSYGRLHDDYIRFHERDPRRLAILKGNRVLPRLVRMLTMKRVDAIIEEEAVLEYYLKTTVNPVTLRFAGLGYTEELYVAFSPAIRDAHVLAEALSVYAESQVSALPTEQ